MDRDIRRDLDCRLAAALDSNEYLRNQLKQMQIKCRDLENQAAARQKYQIELLQAAQMYKTKYDQLSVEFQEKKVECEKSECKYKDLRISNISVENKVNELAITCSQLEARNKILEEKQKIKIEAVKEEQARIKYLEEESKQIRENCVQLSGEIKNLECGKKKLSDEIEVLKAKLTESESQAATWLKSGAELEKTLEVYKDKCLGLSAELKKKEMECAGFANEVKSLVLEKDAVEDDLEVYKKKITSLRKERDVMSDRERIAQERNTCLEGVIEKMKNDEKETIVQLKTEKRELECEKKKLNDEIEVLKEKLTISESQATTRLQRGVELGTKLEVYRIKCGGLSKELKEKEMECVGFKDEVKNLKLVKVAQEEKLEEYKMIISGMEEKITSLGKERDIMSDRERITQQRNTDLEGVVKKMENDAREMSVQFKTEKRDLECGKQREECEIETWKKRFTKLEALVLRLEEENATLKGLQNEVCCDDKHKMCKNKKTCSKMDGEVNVATVDPSRKKDNMLNKTKTISTSAFPPNPSSVKGNIGEVHLSDSPFISNQSEPSEAIKDNQKNIQSDSKVGSINAVRKQLSSETEGSSREKLLLIKQGAVTSSTGIIEINDSEDEREIIASVDETLKSSSGNGKNLGAKKHLKRPLSAKKDEECERNFDEDVTLVPLPPTTKRSRISKSAISRSESQDDDTIPIGKLPNLCNGDEKVERLESSSRRSFSLKPCQKKKIMAKGTSRNESATLNNLQRTRMPYQKAANPTSANVQENVGDEFGSFREGERFNRIIEKSLDSADSGDSSSESEDLGQQIAATIKKKRLRQPKWQFEADMLTSLEEDSELCMKAICALYRQQISEEKTRGSQHSNKLGFNPSDSLRGTKLADFLMDRNQEDGLKKSVKELGRLDPEALEICRTLAVNHSKQLFSIYQSKDDPFFFPS